MDVFYSQEGEESLVMVMSNLKIWSSKVLHGTGDTVAVKKNDDEIFHP